MTNNSDWSLRSGWTLHCKFRGNMPIEELKVGPRGGLWARIGSEWKRARKTRAKPKN